MISVSLSRCGSVVSVKLWVCAVGQSVCQGCGSVVSIRLWVCAVGQSVGLAVGLCPAMCLCFIPSETKKHQDGARKFHGV